MFLVYGGGRYITTSFTVDEELSMISMLSNDFAFYEVSGVMMLCLLYT